MIVIPRTESAIQSCRAAVLRYSSTLQFLKNKGNLGILRTSVDGNLLVLYAFYNGYICIANSELPLFW